MKHGRIPGGRCFGAITGVQILASAVGLPTPIALPDGRRPDWILNEDIYALLLGADYAVKLQAMGLKPEYPEQVIGLKRRRWTHLIGSPVNHDEEHCVHLGVKAVQALLTQTQLSPSDIDLVLLATTTPHKTTTSSACALGAACQIQAPCIDIKAGCSTGLFALMQASMYVKSGFERVLLVVSETPSKYANPRIQETVMGVGDAAVAVLLGPGSAEQGLLGGLMGSDGQLGELVQTPGLLPPSVAAIEAGQYAYHGEAAVLKDAVPPRYLDALQGTLEAAGQEVAAIDWYLPHQVNRQLTAGVAAKAGIAPEKQIHVLQDYGSVTAAGVLLALHSIQQDQRLQPGQLLALNTVGGGLSWGALIWRH
ncbi:MAG: hypothetical protein IGS03_18415 [Candidatus Sericytochromatia bacterium]|nr:hypothetical protein [Candidatus Sericytochromatia bacterium]